MYVSTIDTDQSTFMRRKVLDFNPSTQIKYCQIVVVQNIVPTENFNIKHYLYKLCQLNSIHVCT